MQLLASNATLEGNLVKTHLIVKTMDGRSYSCPKEIMKGSLLIREVLEDEDDAVSAPPGGASSVSGEAVVAPVEIPLPAIDSKAFAAVFEYLEHHSGDTAGGRVKEIERPLRSDLSALIEPWDWKFVLDTLLLGVGEKGIHNLFSVLNASNYLNVLPLRDLCGAAIANLVRNKSEEDILHLFGITEPFTKEQEDELVKEFPWLKD
mmetsp:Transcript_45591/g.52676  ORF Transcript_45591/g.52676 Transcript_45591/m.52676 type:complete len:205 (+) Transcript_45591:97-711(+)|eukprot:CAMPEP_0176449112 /NCGR_PEP_ID=MMETSP0127-20121128/26244_1 /TAXON_ID=938130 /ORGANISM="Platyophrya macrostoma, Strain WH" /LENGTH=204 /DNA_ID=CAMNT_0017836309 /DNA_START=89 /DNA_END=703 /DNA_ORIENTATION=-